MKDVRLPVQLQRAMAAEAEATREARAKVIAAEVSFIAYSSFTSPHFSTFYSGRATG